jgi:hypothetical protein
MPNKVRGESEFLAGTERYVMKLTLGALAEIENGLGVSSLSDIAGKLKSLGTMDLATVASALLHGGGHTISPAEVLKLETDLGTLIGAITAAFDAVGLSSPVHGGGVAQSATEGAHSSPLAGTSSSPSA